MWEDTKNGYTATFTTKEKKEVAVEINKHKQICVVNHANGLQQVVCGVRDNKVKIWNDQIFDPGTNNSIRLKMEATVIKKPKDVKKGR